jgi:hypothetical protein
MTMLVHRGKQPKGHPEHVGSVGIVMDEQVMKSATQLQLFWSHPKQSTQLVLVRCILFTLLSGSKLTGFSQLTILVLLVPAWCTLENQENQENHN